MRQSSAARQRAEDAEENLESLLEDVKELEQELQEKVSDIAVRWEGSALELEEVPVTPRRADVDVAQTAIGWLPFRRVEYEIGGTRAELDIPAY